MGAFVASIFWLTIGNFMFIRKEILHNGITPVGAAVESQLRENAHEKERRHRSGLRDAHRFRPRENGFRIWAYAENSDVLPPVIMLNLRTWRHHNPNADIVVVNDTTVKQYIPDVPDEFFLLYPAAKSDAFRAAIIFNHGGFYADLDFLVMGSLSKMAHLLQMNDIVAYTSTDDSKCQESFSSNFHGGIRRNPFSAAWWENIKDKITRICDTGEMTAEKVCCHAKDNPNPMECHIPWAFLEHLKLLDHEQMPKVQPGNITSTRACLAGYESFQVDLVGTGAEMLWRTWPYDYDGLKCDRVGDDLFCVTKTKETRTVKYFFRRIAYHLFFSSCSNKSMSEEELIGGDMLLSYMYRQSLGIPAPVAPVLDVKRDQSAVCN